MMLGIPEPIITLADKANAYPEEMGSTAGDLTGATAEVHRRKKGRGQ
jgi:hypothetical protein